jgi:uncharacterized protein
MRNRVAALALVVATVVGVGAARAGEGDSPLFGDVAGPEASVSLRSVADVILDATLERLDAADGGGSEGPRRPPGAVLALAFLRYAESGDPRTREVITRTLDLAAAGAIRDQLDGGFFRSSADPAWKEPRFEKRDHVQADMLMAYLQAYQMTGERRYRIVAEELFGYVQRVLARPGGGFTASQGLDDSSGYYLWSEAEVRRALPRGEADLVIRHWGLGATRRPPAIERSLERIAAETGDTVDRIEARLERAKARLRAVRARRGEPTVDSAVYADRQGLLVSACLEVYRVLGSGPARKVALRALDFVGARLRQPDGGLAHRYEGGRVTAAGLLGDQVIVARAYLDAFEATGQSRYLAAARQLMDYSLARFGDRRDGGFFGRAGGLAASPGELKPFVDDEMPAGNPLAAIVLERLHRVTGEPEYERQARETLAAFPGFSGAPGPHLATYAYARDQLERGSIRAVIVGDKGDPRTGELTRAALDAFRPGKVVLALDAASAGGAQLPAPVAAMLAKVPGSEPRAYVCTASLCSLPASSPARVRTLVESFGQVR